MGIGFLISGFACLVFAWLWLHNRQAGKRPANLTLSQVTSALENLISEESVLHDEFDMFISRAVVDPYLETVRQRALEIARRNPGKPGQDISDPGALEIKQLLSELRERT